MLEITKREQEVLGDVLSTLIAVNAQMKLHGHQIDSAKEEEILLRGVVYKLSKVEFDEFDKT